jgi:integrase
MKLSEALTKYEKYVRVTKSKGTYRFTKGKSKTLLEHFGNIECKDIDRTEILDFIIFLRERNNTISNASINKYIGLLLRILKSECNIILEFDKLPEEKKMIQVIPDNVIQKVFKYLDNDLYPEHLRNLVLFRILLDTGLRISEALSLQLNNFDFETRTILVTHTKTKVDRYVFYSPETQNYLTKYIVQSKIESHLFINLVTREPLKVDRIQKICQNIQKKIKTRFSISPHKWRHTFATHFISRNGNMEVLRILMGHTNLLTTQKYLHINSQKLRQEYERVNYLSGMRA